MNGNIARDIVASDDNPTPAPTIIYQSTNLPDTSYVSSANPDALYEESYQLS